MKPKNSNDPPFKTTAPQSGTQPYTDPLQQTGDTFNLLVESISDQAIFLIDTDGIIKSWNAGAKNIHWYNADEIIGKHISIFYSDDEVKNNIPALNLRQATKLGQYECEGWRRRKNGSLFWGNVTFTALRNVQGVRIGFAKVTRDITAQKRAEAKISYLAQLIDKTSDAIFSLSSSYYILSWNKAAELMYGYTAEEVLLKQVADILRADITGDYRDETRKELIAKGFWSGEIKHRRKDNTELWVFLSVTMSRDNKGNTDEYICICRDITNEKKAEEERLEVAEKIELLAREKLRESLKEIDDYKYALNKSSIVAITGADGIITYVNDNFCIACQYTAAELIGNDHRIVNSGYHPKQFMQALWHTIQNGDVWKGEMCNKKKDGTLYWVDTTIVPFVNEKGNPCQYLSIRTDITAKKNAEHELTLLNEQLEERVKNRTQLLELANKELESFSYSVSHDLRAPLRAISGYSKMVQEDYAPHLGGEGNRLLDTIITNARTMGQLIDDLLKFSRLGRKELTMGDIDMEQMVQNCLQELLGNGHNNITVKVEELLPCYGDANMLKQVWLNFIGNAIKYSSKNEAPEILIGNRLEKAMIIYYIKDNGVGFDMQYGHKLFGVFQRLHRADEFEGTGVGLALVKRIVNKHCGQVWAEGQPGVGATFYFSMPEKITV